MHMDKTEKGFYNQFCGFLLVYCLLLWLCNHTKNSSTQEAEAEGPQAEGLSKLHSKLYLKMGRRNCSAGKVLFMQVQGTESSSPEPT